MEETCSKTGSSEEKKKIRLQGEQALSCPRCNSTNTKFSYYNNYSLTQPRYFCKTCRRYWTEDGSLRNIPVGRGSREKNKRHSSSLSLPSTSSSSSKKLPELIIPPSSNQIPAKNVHEGQDLNLGFPASHHDFNNITELMQAHNFGSNTKENNKKYLTSSSSSNSTTTTTCHDLLPLELLTGNSFMPLPITTAHPTSVNSSSSSGGFSLDGGYGSPPGVQESNWVKFLFPFGDLKRVSTTSSTDHNDQQNRDQHADSTG